MKLIILLAALLTGCGYNNTKTPIPLQSPDQAQPNDTNSNPAKVDFAAIKSKIFGPKCLSCHSDKTGNKGGINLETYEKVKPIVNNILAEVKNNTMPKQSAPLSAADKNLLEKWIKEGALEVANSESNNDYSNSTPTPVPTNPPQPTPCEDHKKMLTTGVLIDIDHRYSANTHTMELERRHDDCDDDHDDDHDDDQKPDDDNIPAKIDFAYIREKIFEPRCFKCHSEKGGNRDDINLETYENVKPIVQNILASVKDNSMPRKAAPLSDSDKALLEKWIAEGAIEIAP